MRGSWWCSECDLPGGSGKGNFAGMRTMLFVLFALVSSSAMAQDWGHYANPRFGFSVDVPPQFELDQSSDNGDGTSYYRAQGAAHLYVWGANMLEPEFTTEVEQAIAYSAGPDEGGTVTYQAITPEWASFSGLKSGQIFYQRMVLLCDRSSWAAFRLEYSIQDSRMDPVISRLIASLKGNCS